jgi:hypothetical protein
LTPLVVDASLTAAWCFDDEETQYARDILSRAEQLDSFVPAIWPVEMVNVLLVNERRRRITAADTARAVTLFNELAIHVDRPPSLFRCDFAPGAGVQLKHPTMRPIWNLRFARACRLPRSTRRCETPRALPVSGSTPDNSDRIADENDHITEVVTFDCVSGPWSRTQTAPGLSNIVKADWPEARGTGGGLLFDTC